MLTYIHSVSHNFHILYVCRLNIFGLLHMLLKSIRCFTTLALIATKVLTLMYSRLMYHSAHADPRVWLGIGLHIWFPIVSYSVVVSQIYVCVSVTIPFYFKNTGSYSELCYKMLQVVENSLFFMRMLEFSYIRPLHS